MSTSLDAAPGVDTVSGPVLGRARAVVVDGAPRTVHDWSGLPYATARRFAPAGPPPSWTAPRRADRSGPAAPQLGRDATVLGDEDGCTTGSMLGCEISAAWSRVQGARPETFASRVKTYSPL